MTWISDLQGLTTVLDGAGTELPRRTTIQFDSGLSVTDDGTKTVVANPLTADTDPGEVLGTAVNGSAGPAAPLSRQQLAAIPLAPAPSTIAIARGDRIASDVTIPSTATALTLTPTGGTGVVMLHGLAATSGRRLVLRPASGAYFWVRLNSSVESTAANRIVGPGTEYFWFVGPGASLALEHNGTNWTIVGGEREAGAFILRDDWAANFGVTNRIGQLGWVHNFSSVAKATSTSQGKPSQTATANLSTHATAVLSESTTGSKYHSGRIYAMRVAHALSAVPPSGTGTVKIGFGLVQSAAAASLNGTTPTFGTDGVGVFNEYTVAGAGQAVIIGRATASATSYTTTAFTHAALSFVDYWILRGGASGNEWSVYANGALIGTLTGAPAATTGLIPVLWVDNDNDTNSAVLNQTAFELWLSRIPAAT